MHTPRPSWFQLLLARISLGAVPVGGAYWFEPRASSVKEDGPQPMPDADWSPVGLRLSRPIKPSAGAKRSRSETP